MSQSLHAHKISAPQLAALLILSRLFILLIYVPNTHNAVVGTPALLGILLGGVLTCIALLPAYFLFRKCPGMDLHQIARQLSPALGKGAAALFYLCCMVVAAETAAQFTMFLTSAVYPRASVLWVSVIFCAAVLYMAVLGLEAVTRSAAIMLVVGVCASLLVGCGLWRFVDTLNLITPFYDGLGAVLQASLLYFTQNIELVAFVLLISHLNTGSVRGAFLRYHLIVSLILLLVGLAAITVLGSYGQTRNFPIYTLFALSGSNIFYRFDFVLVAVWVATALVRTALYLILATRMLDELTGRRLGQKLIAVNGVVVLLIALLAGVNVKLFQTLYRLLASGVPVYLLVVALPVMLLLLLRCRKGQENGDQKGQVLFPEGEVQDDE